MIRVYYKLFPILKQVKKGEKIYYFGTDYRYKLKLKSLAYVVPDISKQINKAAEESIYELIDYVTVIGKKQRRQEIWWMSRVASKFNLKTAFFERIVILKIVLDFIKRNNNKNILVSDTVLYYLLKSNLKGYAIFKNSLRPFIDIIFHITKQFYLLFKNRISFLLEYLKYNSLVTPQQTLKGKKKVFIYSWLERRSFNEKGEINDVYLPGIMNQIESDGCYFFSYYSKKELIKIAKKKYNFLSLAFFSNIRIILKSVIILFFVKGTIKYQNYDLKLLWLIEIIDENASFRFISNYHDYLAFKIFLRKYTGIVIYPFENQPWEKGMLLAAKESKSQMKFVGYQHSSIGKMQINYHTTDNELDYIPMPSTIIVNNNVNLKLMRKLLRKSSISVFNGGALRYKELKKDENRLDKSFKNIIAVLLPIDRKQAKELFDDVISNNDFLEFNFFIKFHPDTILQIPDKLPTKIKIFKQDISELYSQCDAVVYCSSSCGLEAYSLGIPVYKYEGYFIDYKMGEYSFQPKTINTILELKEQKFIKKSFHKLFSDLNIDIWKNVTRLYIV